MHPHLRRIAAVLLIASVWAFLTLPVKAEGGVHLVAIESAGVDSWIAREFIDNSLVADAVRSSEEDRHFLPLHVEVIDGSDATFSILAGQSHPLVLVANERLNPLEERLAESERVRVRAELERELTRQIAGGLFQVPLWPYLAASEVPLRGVDIERSFRLPDLREGWFPAALYAGTGGVPSWDVVETQAIGVVVVESGEEGEGGGVVVEYLLEGPLTDFRFPVPADAGIYALYVEDGSGWEMAGVDVRDATTSEVLGILDERCAEGPEEARYSAISIHDSVGELGRFLVMSGTQAKEGGMYWQGRSEPVPVAVERPGGGPGALPVIFGSWAFFGLLVVAGNWMYRFTTVGPLELLGRSLGAYPVYLLVSMLTAGLWGLGFIPAAVATARMVSEEGRRLQAAGVLLAASFIISFVSWFIVW